MAKSYNSTFTIFNVVLSCLLFITVTSAIQCYDGYTIKMKTPQNTWKTFINKTKKIECSSEAKFCSIQQVENALSVGTYTFYKCSSDCDKKDICDVTTEGSSTRYKYCASNCCGEDLCNADLPADSAGDSNRPSTSQDMRCITGHYVRAETPYALELDGEFWRNTTKGFMYVNEKSKQSLETCSAGSSCVRSESKTVTADGTMVQLHQYCTKDCQEIYQECKYLSLDFMAFSVKPEDIVCTSKCCHTKDCNSKPLTDEANYDPAVTPAPTTTQAPTTTTPEPTPTFPSTTPKPQPLQCMFGVQFVRDGNVYGDVRPRTCSNVHAKCVLSSAKVEETSRGPSHRIYQYCTENCATIQSVCMEAAKSNLKNPEDAKIECDSKCCDSNLCNAVDESEFKETDETSPGESIPDEFEPYPDTDIDYYEENPGEEVEKVEKEEVNTATFEGPKLTCKVGFTLKQNGRVLHQQSRDRLCEPDMQCVKSKSQTTSVSGAAVNQIHQYCTLDCKSVQHQCEALSKSLNRNAKVLSCDASCCNTDNCNDVTDQEITDL